LISLAGGGLRLALSWCGFRIPRDLAATWERVGLTAPKWRHVGVVLVAIGATLALNLASAEIERRFFPALWGQDKRVLDLMIRGMRPAEGILLGLSAGVGEELVFRGALQPRLGLVRTTLLFAALHGQYSWFGIGEVLVLGLALGWIRARANTTAAIAVHAAYDIVGVFAGGR
jgi:membrane protease YdiL (CAAX protease family)